MPRSSIKVGEGRLERPELVAQQQQFRVAVALGLPNQEQVDEEAGQTYWTQAARGESVASRIPSKFWPETRAWPGRRG
jgi:hypothetical protein